LPPQQQQQQLLLQLKAAEGSLRTVAPVRVGSSGSRRCCHTVSLSSRSACLTLLAAAAAAAAGMKGGPQVTKAQLTSQWTKHSHPYSSSSSYPSVLLLHLLLLHLLLLLLVMVG
jgi:hypothetical protein